MVAIPEANPVFEAPARFSIDGLTEKVSLMAKKLLPYNESTLFPRSLTDHYFQLHLFKCPKEEELRKLITKHIYFVSPSTLVLYLANFFQFMQEKGGGLACLLYSLVLSKGFDE